MALGWRVEARIQLPCCPPIRSRFRGEGGNRFGWCKWPARESLVFLASFVTILAPLWTGAATPTAPQVPGLTNAASIPWNEIGSKATAQYGGEGLSVVASEIGARLKCVFQRLEGTVSAEGLWLTSTATEASGERFRVRATAVGREELNSTVSPVSSRTLVATKEARGIPLSAEGRVEVSEGIARFVRAGLVEEYRVSADGVRQDFLIAERPAGTGNLRVDLAVDGAKTEALGGAARLVLPASGRKLDYHGLRVTDATGRQLTARLDAASSTTLAIYVEDDGASYPVRIDPTISDSDWTALCKSSGPDGVVRAAATGYPGELYIGGDFVTVGDLIVNHVAKWNGSEWSALGRGTQTTVLALGWSGGRLYVGGYFRYATNAGGMEVHTGCIAGWDGIGWTRLGEGSVFDGNIYTLAISGSNVFAGGDFSVYDENIWSWSHHYVARWDGNGWSGLAQGLDNTVHALAVSGNHLYVGGSFTTATNSGGETVKVTHIARWDGSAWAALGGGLDSSVYALAVADNELFAGGFFRTATNSGGSTVSARYIARWNGTTWSPLALGLDGPVYALASRVTPAGRILFAGGSFNWAEGVAQWDGSAWSAVGPGRVFGGVYALVANDLGLYAGGFRPDPDDRGRVGFWNGSRWETVGEGVNGWVKALAVADDGFYLAGRFTVANGVRVNHIAKWDGKEWLALGPGTDGPVLALAVSGTNLYAAGDFLRAGGARANRIARWDGRQWWPLGEGMNDEVSALAVSGGILVAGGRFTRAGGTEANHIAGWNGNAWSALGGGVDSAVSALAVAGNDVYAGGSFLWATDAGGHEVLTAHVARWNGSSWSAVGQGVNGYVAALAVSGNDLYVGGAFTTATASGVAVPVNRIARWNGATWSALAHGVNDTVEALAVSGNTVYAGGWFTKATNAVGVTVAVNHVARWSGSGWIALGGGMDRPAVSALAVSGDTLLAGGSFDTADGRAANRVARWDGWEWNGLEAGVNGPVQALAVIRSNLYAAGSFTQIGGTAARNVARWDGARWSALGVGLNGQVRALAVAGEALYAGGEFTMAGGVAANQVAKWNGVAWSPLGAGPGLGGFIVRALAAAGNELYAEGWAGEEARIAKWNGSEWSAPITLLRSEGWVASVYALAVLGGDLYVGGYFKTATNAGGTTVTVNHIARWNGTEWSALGRGLSGQVRALVVSGSDLYVGGYFHYATNANEAAVLTGGVARWDGSTWATLDPETLSGGVDSLAISGTELYAGGSFYLGSAGFQRVAKWDGSTWTVPESGIGGDYQSVNAVAVMDGHLFVGGRFGLAGGQPCDSLARVSLSNSPSPPAITQLPQTQTVQPGDVVDLHVTATGTAPLAYQWFRNGYELFGSTSPWHSIGYASANDTGSYSVVVSNAWGSVTSAPAVLTVESALEEALDLPLVPWEWRDWNSTWFSQTRVTHDGVDAAQSGSSNHGQESTLSMSLEGPGRLTFWWKVSSQANSDFLELHLDWLPQPGWISGEEDWQAVELEIPAGVHFLEWRYRKDNYGHGGADCGWVDQVRFVPTTGAPTIVSPPQDLEVPPMDRAVFEVVAGGEEPLFYQWFKDNVPLDQATNRTYVIGFMQWDNAGSYRVMVSNHLGSAEAAARLSFLVGPDVGPALDAPELSWQRSVIGGSGGGPWFGQYGVSHDGEDSAQSGHLPDLAETWVLTHVTGPGSLSFWWKVSSEVGHDFLEFHLDHVLQSGRISGGVDWEQVSVNVPAGNHELGWRYVKDGGGEGGLDRGWVDQVRFVPTVPARPMIVMNDGGMGVSNGQFGFNLTGPSGQVVVVEASTNLQAGSWQGIWTNTFGSEPLRFSAPVSSTNRGRYYRLWLP